MSNPEPTGDLAVAAEPPRRLRIAHVIVQTVLVWDDGNELVPAQQVAPLQVPLSHLAQLAERIPHEVARLEQAHRAGEEPSLEGGQG